MEIYSRRFSSRELINDRCSRGISRTRRERTTAFEGYTREKVRSLRNVLPRAEFARGRRDDVARDGTGKSSYGLVCTSNGLYIRIHRYIYIYIDRPYCITPCMHDRIRIARRSSRAVWSTRERANSRHGDKVLRVCTSVGVTRPTRSLLYLSTPAPAMK